MKRQKKGSTLKSFSDEIAREGVSYAEAQIRETQGMIGRVRAPRDEDGPVYMKVSARNALKNAKRKSGRKRTE